MPHRPGRRLAAAGSATLGMSAALHVAALWMAGTALVDGPLNHAAPAPVVRTVLVTRTVPASARPEAAGGPAGLSAAPAQAMMAQAAPEPPTPAAAEPVAPAAPRSAPSMATPVSEADSDPVTEPTANRDAPALPDPARLAQDYHRRSALTRGPMLVTPVSLDLPVPDVHPDPDARLRMRLLIGLDGSVEHVLVEQSSLDALARDAAIQRFAAARYAPGEIDGQPARSQVLIEVGYGGR